VEDDELREEEKAVAAGAPPCLRSNDDPDAAARPAQPRSACADPSLRQGPCQQARGEVHRRRSFSSPTAAGNADDPSVANPRDPLPLLASVPLLVQGPVAPSSSPQLPSPLRRHVVPRAWDAGAPRTVRPRRGPGMPGPAHVRAHPCRETSRAPALPCPHHGLAVRDDPRDVAATSRSRHG
jgi:hypothetical protein